MFGGRATSGIFIGFNGIFDRWIREFSVGRVGRTLAPKADFATPVGVRRVVSLVARSRALVRNSAGLRDHDAHFPTPAPKMDQEYDAIILGTGLKECLLAGLLSVDGMKVLHMDRNSYYGGESASLNLRQLWEKFRPGEPEPTQYGRWQDWNFDMVPKFMMGNGLLVRTLVHTGVHKYLEFKAVDGSYVFKGGKVYKVRTRATSGRTVFPSPRSLARLRPRL